MSVCGVPLPASVLTGVPSPLVKLTKDFKGPFTTRINPLLSPLLLLSLKAKRKLDLNESP